MIASRALLAIAITATTATGGPRENVTVGPGTYRPAFPATPAEREIPVEKFRLDVYPVTNAEFLAFVRAKQAWQRGTAKRIVVDKNYLAHWSSADDLGSALGKGPVVHVSWFAARAFCASRGGRLPTEREWELAAAATRTSRTPPDDAKRETEILTWYLQPSPSVLHAVGGPPNAWGVSDMHGLIWEWIEDFNAALVASDSRTPDRNVFCGGAGATSRDAAAYATFMRVAFRSSLEARFTTSSLGFRCAYDVVQR